METRHRNAFLRDGCQFPVRVLSSEQAADYRARFDAFDGSERARQIPDLHNDVYLFKPHLLLKWVDDLVHEPGVLDAAEAILGPNLLCWSAGVFQKVPHSPHHVSWHQDAVYYGLAPVDRVVRVWIALSPCTRANGTMEFATGAHRLGLRRHHPHQDESNLLTKGEEVAIDLSPFKIVPVELEPGEASIHHLHIPHASSANATDIRRVNLVITYIAPDVVPASGADSALLVRGTDTHGNFQAETRLDAEFSPNAVAAHARAIAMRRRVFAQAAPVYADDP